MALDNRDPEIEFLVMNARDKVATALRDVRGGTLARFVVDGEERQVPVLDDIPFGHKIAIALIRQGEHVIKYGEVIGKATQEVEVGRHVHVHNVAGIRGRGDLHPKGVNLNETIRGC